MECNKEEAIRAMDIAKRKVTETDYNGAKTFAKKAQNLYPQLDGLKQVLRLIDVYVSAGSKLIGGESDWYGILGVDPLADDEAVKKQYRRLALLLHPDKNKCQGAEGAFKLVLEAWSLLSDKAKRAAYDQKRKVKQVQPRQRRKQKQPADPKKQPQKQPKQPPDRKKQRANQKKEPENQEKQPSMPQEQPQNQEKQPSMPQKQPENQEKQPSMPQKQPENQQKQPPNRQKQPSTSQKQPEKQQKQPPNRQEQPSTTQKQPSNQQKQSSTPLKQPSTAQKQPPTPTKQQKQPSTQQSSNGARNGRGKSSKPVSKVGTFWTVCDKCGTQQEYVKVFYLGKTVRCIVCRMLFTATEREKTCMASSNSGNVANQPEERLKRGVEPSEEKDEVAARGIGNSGYKAVEERVRKKLRIDDCAEAIKV